MKLFETIRFGYPGPLIPETAIYAQKFMESHEGQAFSNLKASTLENYLVGFFQHNPEMKNPLQAAEPQAMTK